MKSTAIGTISTRPSSMRIESIGPAGEQLDADRETAERQKREIQPQLLVARERTKVSEHEEAM